MLEKSELLQTTVHFKTDLQYNTPTKKLTPLSIIIIRSIRKLIEYNIISPKSV